MIHMCPSQTPLVIHRHIFNIKCQCYIVYIHVGNLVLLIWQQTSTADMLDLAVEYIKDLQEQVQVQENYIPYINTLND
jgi:hypothetical protein